MPLLLRSERDCLESGGELRSAQTVLLLVPAQALVPRP